METNGFFCFFSTLQQDLIVSCLTLPVLVNQKKNKKQGDLRNSMCTWFTYLFVTCFVWWSICLPSPKSYFPCLA